MLAHSSQVTSLVESQVRSLVGFDSSPSFIKKFGAPSAAYSLRDLNDERGNNRVVRALRTNDGVARDFTAKEITNGTLTSWATNTNAFVTTWYDQSGLGRDASTTNPLFPIIQAPQIADNGTLFTTNNTPSLLFNNSKLSVSQDITGEDFSVFAVVEPHLEDPSTDGYIFDNFTSYGRGLFHDDFYSGRFTLITDTTSTTPKRSRIQITLETPQSGGVTTPALQLVSGVIENTSASDPNGSMRLRNRPQRSSSDQFYFNNELPYQENTFVQYIGAGANAGSNPFDGFISELIVYTGAGHYNQSKRLAIEDNIANHYSLQN
tara:strand:- start:20814 stop:21773 length:960 start_codon:yes stop_codon:yes gene_type:complete